MLILVEVDTNAWIEDTPVSSYPEHNKDGELSARVAVEADFERF